MTYKRQRLARHAKASRRRAASDQSVWRRAGRADADQSVWRRLLKCLTTASACAHTRAKRLSAGEAAANAASALADQSVWRRSLATESGDGVWRRRNSPPQCRGGPDADQSVWRRSGWRRSGDGGPGGLGWKDAAANAGRTGGRRPECLATIGRTRTKDLAVGMLPSSIAKQDDRYPYSGGHFIAARSMSLDDQSRALRRNAESRDRAAAEFQEVAFDPVREDDSPGRHLRPDHQFLTFFQDGGDITSVCPVSASATRSPQYPCPRTARPRRRATR